MTADALTPLPEPPRLPGVLGTAGLGCVILLGASFASLIGLAALLVFGAAAGVDLDWWRGNPYDGYEAASRYQRAYMEVAGESHGIVTTATALAAAPAVLLLAAAFALQYRSSPREFLGFRWPTLPQALFWTAAVLALRPALSALMEGSGIAVNGDESGLDEYRTALILPLFYLAVAVAVPVMEEVLFRGFLLEGWRRTRLGLTGAVILTSLLWASLHSYETPVLFIIFCEGILLAMARVRTGSTYLAIGLHGVINLMALLSTAAFLASNGTGHYLEKGRQALAQQDGWEASLAFHAAESYSDQPCAECRLGLAQAYLIDEENERAARAARQVLALHPPAELRARACSVLSVVDPLSRSPCLPHPKE